MHAPTGRAVAIAFSEIDGLLARRPGPALDAALALHDRILRERIAARGGTEVKARTGGFMAVFPSGAEALRWTLETQEALTAAVWPGETGELRVGIGLHVGEPIVETDAATGKPDYFGPAVNRAARIAAAAHGGQTLLSQQALEAGLDTDAKPGSGARKVNAIFRSLGDHRLRGLDRPEPLFQALPPSQRDRRFPPVRAIPASPTNLPAQTTSFVGRERELAELSSEKARVLVLTGPAGTGKTRLAVRLAVDLLDRHEGGCWFADLSEARDPAGMAAAVAQALDAPLPPGADPVEQVGAMLEARRPLLLILDTFEHLPPSCRDVVAAWAARAPRARFIVTSRSIPGLPGEREFRVEPMPHDDATRLFVQRAREARPGFESTPENAAALSEIASALEGIPLALELAAARARVMQPAEIVKKLDQKFRLLRSSRQDAQRRQQTLEGALEWSVDLLGPVERRALARATVFRGGFTAEAALAVLAADEAASLDALVERSLLWKRETPVGPRYGMYRLVQEFVGRSLPDADRELLEERHAMHYLPWAERWDDALWTARAKEALDRLELDFENVFAVHDRALRLAAPGESDAPAAARALERALRALLALGAASMSRGSAVDWAARLDRAVRALEVRDDARRLLPAALLSRLFVSVSDCARLRGDTGLASTAADRALDAAGDSPREGVDALRNRATLDSQRGDHARALADLELAASLSRDHALLPRLPEVLNIRAQVLARRHEHDEALATWVESGRLAKEQGYLAAAGVAAANRGALLAALGRLDESMRALEESEDLSRDLARAPSIAGNIAVRGSVHLQRGDYAGALEILARAESLIRDLGRRPPLGVVLIHQGVALERTGNHEQAFAKWKEAEEIYRGLGDRSRLASIHDLRSEAYERFGNLDDALAEAGLSEVLWRELVNRPEEARSATVRGRLLLALKRGGEAREALRHATALFRERPQIHAPAFLAWALLSDAETWQGDERAAMKAATEAMAIARLGKWEGKKERAECEALVPKMKERAGEKW